MGLGEMHKYSSPSRNLILMACKILGFSSVQEILVQMGVPEEEAHQPWYGLNAEVAYARYISEHPLERTSLAMRVIEDAANKVESISDEKNPRVSKFRAEMRRNGLKMSNGKLSLTEKTDPPQELRNEANIPAEKRNQPERGLSADTADGTVARAKSVRGRNAGPTRVFVVHGRNAAALNEVELFLTKLKLEPLVLHQQPNKGRSILVKFQEVAHGAAFAVVIMTAEDEGGLIGQPKQQRARQNVVFELGFFIGKLGSQNVCALLGPGVERPSDFDGIGYVQFGEDRPWKYELARELRAAGVAFSSDHLL